ncbi:MAG: type VI secretion system Vgr family protein, partial [Beijerinckiaceae bacterium]
IEYLVVAASHSFTGEDFSSGGSGGTGTSYHGSYVLQPSDRPYKAPQTTDVPVIAGPQTATVVGPAGEEIHTDKHGRIKVQFHWDREGKKDENSSRWVRVTQIWSGKAWGGIVIPRIGMEVVVEFIEGDPDRPLVVGTVYNAINTPPYTLPDNKTISGVKSRSTKGGSPDMFNEFIFEDKKGEEYVRLHAEKDLNTIIENCETRLISGKTHKPPAAGKATRTTTIEKGDDILDIKDGDSKQTISRDHIVKITRNENVRITGTQTIHADGDILIQSGTKITLKVGGSTITITEASIDIKTTGTITTDASVTTMKTAGPHKINATPLLLNC